MRRLTDHEREALIEIGEPGAGPIPDAVFDELARLGWGAWVQDPDWPNDPSCTVWTVTPAGRLALQLDDAARRAEGR